MNIFFRKNILISLAVLVFSFVASSHVVFAQITEVSRWNGDAVSKTTVSDVQDGNNGTMSGGVTIVPGGNGNVFKFNGSSGRINMGNPANLNFGTTGPFSLEAWFNWDGGGGDINNIIRKSNYSGSPAGYWLRIIRYSNVLEFFTGDTVGIGESSGRVTAPISPNIWYHAIATRDSSGTMKLYLNDELVGTIKAANAATTSGSSFAFGFWPDQNSEFFSGMISEVTVYAGALNSQEVKSIDEEDPQKLKEIAEIEKKLKPFIEKKETPGQCGSFDECQAYCNIEKNFSECSEFGKKIDIVQVVPQEQQAILNAIDKGESPGGCKDEASCRAYCEDNEHLNECVSFVEKFNLATPDELKEIRQIADVYKEGVSFPGNCKTKESCLNYCENSAHQAECMEFGLRAGFIPKEDIEEVNKILPYLKSGGKMPGGCTTKESCDTYCNSDTNVNECVDFAVGAGFIDKDEAVIVKKMGGKGPGDCKSKEQCESFCNNPANQTVCMEFAVKVGIIAPEDADFFKQNMAPQSQGAKGEGFGGFDQMPKKMKECLSNQIGSDAMAKLVSKEVAPSKEMMHAMRVCIEEFKNSCPAFANKEAQQGGSEDQKVGPGTMDANTEKCFKEAFGDDVLEKMKNGDFCPPADMQEKLKPCFEKIFGGQGGSGGPGGEGGQGGGQGSFKGGPGGCKSPEECQAYCQTNPDACKGFTAPTQQQGGQGDGQGSFKGDSPGGCKSPEECTAYCKDHPEACQGSVVPQQQPSGQSGAPTQQQQGQMTGEQCTKQGGAWDGKNCDFTSKGSTTQQVDCSSFAQVPKCEYITDPNSYKYCKQCYPNK